MIVNIKNNKSYITNALAIYNGKNWFDDYLIVFDEDNKYIFKIDMYKKIKIDKSCSKLFKQVYIVDYNDDNFSKSKLRRSKWIGLDYIVNDKNLLKRLKNNEMISIEEVPKLNSFNNEINIPEWFEIKCEHDIEYLLSASVNFHDATLIEAKQSENYLILSFECIETIINIKFENVIENNLYNKLGEILNSKLIYENNIYRFEILDGYGGWVDYIDHDIQIKDAYLSCEKVYWQIKLYEE